MLGGMEREGRFGAPSKVRVRPGLVVFLAALAVLAARGRSASAQATPDWMVEGNQVNARLGVVSSAGDVNSDGYEDVVVGSFTFDNGEANEGAAFLYLGSASGLMPTPSWSAEGNQTEAQFGYSVAGAGDVNGDGYDDVIIGARNYDNGEVDEGRAYVYLGSASGLANSPAWTTESDVASAGYGQSVSTAGDVNDDSFADVIVGAPFLASGQTDEGKAYVYLGSALGLATTPIWTVESDQAGAWFGESVACAGDVNADGFSDVIVGSSFFDNPQSNEGRAFLYLGSALGPSLTASWSEDSDTVGALYGRSVAGAGDVNGDGFDDVVIGAVDFANEGRAYLYLGSGLGLSTVPVWSFESDQVGAGLGHAVASAGDVNGDGYDDVIAGAYQFDSGENDEGRAFLFLGTPTGLEPGPAKVLECNNTNALFGLYVAAADADADGYSDVLVGAREYSGGESGEGATFLYRGRPSFGTVLFEQKISSTSGGFGSGLDAMDLFGHSVAALGDLDGNGVQDLAVGSLYDDDGGTDRGALWILFMNPDASVGSKQKISATAGGFGGALADGDQFGVSVAAIGDLDGDDIVDLAVGADRDEDGGADRGAVWILFLNANGTVKAEQKISDLAGGFSGTLANTDFFGVSVASLGDLDGDTNTDIAVGAYSDDDGGINRGAVWILFLNPDGTVDSHSKLSSTPIGTIGPLTDGDNFGQAVASLGDFDGPGGSALCLGVGAMESTRSGPGSMWLVFLDTSGAALSTVHITEGNAGFGGDLDPLDIFGYSVAPLGHAGGGGVLDIAVGAPYDDDGGTNRGAAWILSLDSDGTVGSQQKISATAGGFTGTLDDGDQLGISLAPLGDLDGDGRVDLAIGANWDDDGVSDAGAVWVCHLNDGTLRLGASATTWTGVTDMQWELASNWGNGVPDAAKTALIPDAATTPNDPVITVAGQECASLWIQGGGTLAVSAGLDSLGVFAGATVSGPITGTGELVFDAPGTLAGNSSITLPLVRAADDLSQQGGPFTINGTLQGDTNIALEGDLTIAGSLLVDGLLSGTADSSLNIVGGGADEVRVGQVCLTGVVISNLPLLINGAGTGLELGLTNGWPLDVRVDVGQITLETSAFTVGGDLILAEGTLTVGVSGSIDANGANGIVIEDGATLDITGFQTLVPAPTAITVQAGGKLNIGLGGELVLQSNTLTIQSGGTLCLDAVPSLPAALSGQTGSRYTLALLSGSNLAAKGFVFRGMASAGIDIDSTVNLAAAPFDLRGGLFDDPAPGGVLLDIERALPTTLRYLHFANSTGSAGAFNVRTSLTSAALRVVNWTGPFAGEPFEDDPGAGEPGLIEWAPPEQSDVQDFQANWGSDHVKLSFETLAEVDATAYLLRRSPESPVSYATVFQLPAVGPQRYQVQDHTVQAQTGYRYRLYELLTHGDVRLIDEVLLPASAAPDVLLPVWGSPAQDPPRDLPLVVGSGGYADVPSALRALAGAGQRDPLTLELLGGVHAAFELGPELSFDVCLVARPGAVIDASLAPLRIRDLSPERALELVGLTVDAHGAAHPAVALDGARGVVLLEDVLVRGGVRARGSDRIALQGGAIEGALELAQASRATASGVALGSAELSGASTLETRGLTTAVVAEPGSSWLARGPAPRLTVVDGWAVLEAEPGMLARLFVAPSLGYHARPRFEGALLLARGALDGVGVPLAMPQGVARWPLGTLAPSAELHVQALALDPLTGRACLSAVVRLEGR